MQVDKKAGSGNTDPLVGKVIHDRFRIIAPIARGGMGVVYKAEQAPLGRLVALKILSPKHEEDQDPEFRKRFFLEAATVAKLSHPNTVTVFDYGQSDHTYFIVMELIDGITLKEALRGAGCFDPPRAIHIAKQICRSLREAHRLGVIHRDMKPGNIMLVQQGDEPDYVKVLDFGLVKDIEKTDDEEDLTQTGVFMGSPKYMSPEQIQGEAVDARSDIYSVGVLLYEMLTGKPPFVRDKQVQILMDHINAPVPELTTPGGARIPEEIANVCFKCLSKMPADRFDDMEQLLLALKLVAGELSLQLPPSGELGFNPSLAGTPVSGIHSVAEELMRSSSAGRNKSALVTSSMSGPSSVSAAPPSSSQRTLSSSLSPSSPNDVTTSASRALSTDAPGGKMAIIVGALALLAAAAIVFFVVDPFGRAVAPTSNDGSNPIAGSRGPERARLLPEVGDSPGENIGGRANDIDDPVEPPVAIVSVLVELDSRPDGATVQIVTGEDGDEDGDTPNQEYGPTPLQVELTGDIAAAGEELTFVFSKAGFRDTTVVRRVPSEGRLEVSARMRRAWRPPSEGSRPTADVPSRAATPAGYRESPY